MVSTPVSDLWARRITFVLTHFMRLFSAHWLAMANLALALYIGLPFLAPQLMHTDHSASARVLYAVFRPLCHQLPERSFFLYGPSAVYSLDQLGAHLGALAPNRFIGDAELGFKVAVCQRCVALYGAMLLAGIGFGAARTRLTPLPFKAFIALIAPLGIDGIGQLVRLWSSTPLSRTVTGVLFGIACIWLAFPYLQRGMAEVHREAVHTLEEWSTP
jgi:uncharacterized membrane protein